MSENLRRLIEELQNDEEIQEKIMTALLLDDYGEGWSNSDLMAYLAAVRKLNTAIYRRMVERGMSTHHANLKPLMEALYAEHDGLLDDILNEHDDFVKSDSKLR